MEAPPPMAVYGPSLAVEDYAELVGFLLAALAFIVLIGLDLRNAIIKGAHWVPGRALVLSALTIQIMNFVENQSGLLNEILEGSEPWNDEIVRNNLFMIHTSRVMLCVLVAYLLPGMARPGSEEKWTKIAAIGLTVFIDIFSELNSARSHLPNSARSRSPRSSKRSNFFYSWPEGKAVSQVSFFVSGAIISITLIWLILLLISTAIASKSIQNITTQKIPIILGEPAEDSWKGVEDQVLKSWIVTRSCYPESIVARSALASSAALGVTICILSSIVGWLVQGPKVTFHRNPAFWLKFIITILEVMFILIGWAIIGFRWITSVAYYGRRKQQNQECCKYFEVEDYWTRHIVDLQEAENLKLRELKVDERISKMFVMKLRKLHVHERVSKMIAKERKRRTSFVSMWLKFVFWLQYYVVFVSKVLKSNFNAAYVRRPKPLNGSIKPPRDIAPLSNEKQFPYIDLRCVLVQARGSRLTLASLTYREVKLRQVRPSDINHRRPISLTVLRRSSMKLLPACIKSNLLREVKVKFWVDHTCY